MGAGNEPASPGMAVSRSQAYKQMTWGELGLLRDRRGREHAATLPLFSHQAHLLRRECGKQGSMWCFFPFASLVSTVTQVMDAAYQARTQSGRGLPTVLWACRPPGEPLSRPPAASTERAEEISVLERQSVISLLRYFHGEQERGLRGSSFPALS